MHINGVQKHILVSISLCQNFNYEGIFLFRSETIGEILISYPKGIFFFLCIFNCCRIKAYERTIYNGKGYNTKIAPTI